MPPTNISPSTAVMVQLSACPYTTTQNVYNAGAATEVWYAVTNDLGHDACVTSWFYGVIPSTSAIYQAGCYVLVDPFGADTEIADPYPNCPVELPIKAGAVYYFDVYNIGASAVTSAMLNVNLSVKPYKTSYPAGQVLILSASNGAPGNAYFSQQGGLPAALIDPVTGSIVNSIPFFCTSENGDALSTGQYLFTDNAPITPAPPAQAYTVLLYDQNLNQVTRALLPAPVSGDANEPLIRACQATGHFWLGSPGYSGAPNRYAMVTSSGVIGPVGTLAAFSPLAEISALAATNDESHLLVTEHYVTHTTIHRWNLSTLAWDTDLTAGPGGSFYATDLLVLADNSVVVSYFKNDGVTVLLNQYTSAGTLLHTYTYTAATTITVTPRIGYAAASGYVWMWLPMQNGQSLLEKINLSTGLALHSTSLTVPNVYETSIETATPSLLYASDSCPVIELPVTGALDPVTTTYQIRRLRRFMLPWDEANRRKWLQRLEFVMQTGIGNANAPNPTVMVRLSKDGGLTWGNEIDLSAGPSGEYWRRLVVHRLGVGRNWVVEMTVSDLADWEFVEVLADLDEWSS